MPAIAVGVGGTLLGALLVAWMGLFASVPAGWTPAHGWAPHAVAFWAPLWVVPSWSMSPQAFQTIALALLLGAWLLWALLFVVAGPVADERATARIAVTAAVVAAVVHLALVLTPPVLSQDLYRYALFGKMMTVHGLNPFDTPASALASDPLLQLASWPAQKSLYGPTFLWLAAAVVTVLGDDPIALAIGFRTLAAIGNLLTAWLIWLLVRQDGGRPLRPLVLWLFSPLALVETAGAGHTEAVMIPLALGALLAARRGRMAAAIALGVAAAAVKPLAGVLVALMFVQTVFAQRGARLVTAARLAGAGLGTFAALYLPFWTGPGTFSEALLHLRGAVGDPDAGPGPGAVALFLALIAAGIVACARLPGLPVGPVAALLIDAFIVLIFPYKLPWYFLTGAAFTAPWLRTRMGRFATPPAFLFGLLAMALYCWLVPPS